MIFKTFNSDIDNSIYKIGVFGKSFGEIIDRINDRTMDWKKIQETNPSMSDKEAKSQVGSIWSYLTNDEKKDALVKEFEAFKTKMSETGKTASALAKEMGDELSPEIQSYIKTSKDGKLTTEGFNKSIGNLSLGAKAANVALKALSIAGNMLLMWGISEAINLIYSCATASDRLRESAEKLGNEFSQTSSDISSYKEKITELKAIINDSNSSYQDSYNARENLLSIQDELIDKYGKEADTIKLITDAVNDSVDALDTLTNAEWESIKAKYTADPDRKWYQKAGDWLSNTFIKDVKNNFDAMVKDMEDTSVAFTIEPEYDNEWLLLFCQRLSR